MRSRTLCLAFVGTICIFVGALVIASMSGGCTPAQQQNTANGLTDAGQKAKNLGGDFTGAPTTSPTQVDTIVRTGVGVTEGLLPSAKPFIDTAGMALTGIGTLLGFLGGAVASPRATAARNALAEVVADVKAWNAPGVSFTTKTEKIVADVAGIAAAAPLVPTASPTAQIAT